MADDVKQQIALSQQLVMTPQLQMAIQLLATPSAQLGEMIAKLVALQPARPQDPDLLVASEEEVQIAGEDGGPVWSFLLERPAELALDSANDADVWIFGAPPTARANRNALPALRIDDTADTAAIGDATWFARALRQRARTYERVVATLLDVRPALATATDPKQVRPVPVRVLAKAVDLHESTITRVASGCRIQNRHGVFALAKMKGGVGIA